MSDDVQLLMSLARKSSPELLQAFDGSFQGDALVEGISFDDDFFLMNVQGILEDTRG